MCLLQPVHQLSIAALLTRNCSHRLTGLRHNFIPCQPLPAFHRQRSLHPDSQTVTVPPPQKVFEKTHTYLVFAQPATWQSCGAALVSTKPVVVIVLNKGNSRKAVGVLGMSPGTLTSCFAGFDHKEVGSGNLAGICRVYLAGGLLLMQQLPELRQICQQRAVPLLHLLRPPQPQLGSALCPQHCPLQLVQG